MGEGEGYKLCVRGDRWSCENRGTFSRVGKKKTMLIFMWNGLCVFPVLIRNLYIFHIYIFFFCVFFVYFFCISLIMTITLNKNNNNNNINYRVCERASLYVCTFVGAG